MPKDESWSTDRGTIPNRNGLAVRVLLDDGSEADTEVERDALGRHVLRGIAIGRVVAWKNR